MRRDTPGWESACLVAEGWFSPARSLAAFVQRLVFRSSYLREARLLGTGILLFYSGITTHAPTFGKASDVRLENRDFDVQELLPVLPEIFDQQPHIPRQPPQIIVHLPLEEEVPRRRGF